MASWFVAVTTAPRKDCTLVECLQSIVNCGWSPVVFAEPGATEQTTFETRWNDTRLGVWHNWLASCRAGVASGADYVLTVQDDSLFHPDSREFIESIDWPADAAFVSLYTPKHYTVKRDNTLRPCGVRRVNTRSLWGACALVWRRETLASVISHRVAASWLGAGPARKKRELSRTFTARRAAWFAVRRNAPFRIANSDTAIGKICNAMGLGMWFVDPSPVSHIAKYSTIGHGGNDGRRNAYRIADHSLPLSYQVFGK
jgi:hypothetical protein